MSVVGTGGTVVAVGIAVWGGVYVWRCLDTLLDPAVPVTLEYEGQSGRHRLSSAQYRVDPVQQSVSLDQVRLIGPQGETIAHTGRMRVKWDGTLFTVNAPSMSALAIRDRAGRFNLAGVLPKAVKGAKAPPVRFHSAVVRVGYRDETGPKVLSKQALLTTFAVDSVDEDTVVSARLSVDSLRHVPLDVQLGTGGKYWLSVGPVSGPVASLWPVAERYVEPGRLKGLEPDLSGGLDLKGTVVVRSDGKSPAQVTGQVDLSSPRAAIGNKISGAVTASLQGSLDLARVTARVADGPRRASFDGIVATGERLRAEGNVEFSSRDGSVWRVVPKLPKGTTLRGGALQGKLALDGDVVSLVANARVARVAFQGESLTQVSANISLSGDQMYVNVDRGTWEGTRLSVALEANLKSGQLKGLARLPEREIGPIASKYGIDWLKGRASGLAVIDGTVSKPSVDLALTGGATVKTNDGREVVGGALEARAKFDGRTLNVSRLTVSGPNAFVSANGQFDPSTGRLNGHYVAGPVALSAWDDRLKGSAFAKGSIAGTVSEPSFASHVEVYGASVDKYSVAQVIAEVSGDKNGVDVASLRASSGIGLLTGSGRYDLNEKSIKGKFKGSDLFLSEYLGPDIVGRFEVVDGQVSGPVDNLSVTAGLASPRATVFGAPVEKIRASLSYQGSKVSVEDLSAAIERGTVQGQASFDTKTEAGLFSLSASGVPLNRLWADNPDVALEGTFDADGKGSWAGNKWTLDSTWGLSNVSVNGTAIGSGRITAVGGSDRVNLQGEIGSVDRFLSLEDTWIQPEDRKFASQVSAYNILLQDAIAAAKPYWSKSLDPNLSWITETQGSFTGTALLASTADSWTLTAADMDVTGLRLAGRDAGEVSAKLTHSGELWDVESLRWTTKDSTLEAFGSYEEGGLIDLSAQATDFDLSWIKTLSPDSPLVTGRATAAVVLKGPKDDPTGRGSLLVRDAVVNNADGAKASPSVQLLLNDVTIGNKRILASGNATSSGFTGAIEANIPYSSLEPPDDRRAREPFSASLTFAERPIAEFKDLFKDIDFENSDGTVALKATIDGYWEQLRVSANGQLRSGRLVSASLGTELHNVSVDYQQANRVATINMSADSGLSGSMKAAVTANVADVFGSEFSADDLLDDSTAKGQVTFEKFAWSQKMPGAVLPTVVRIDGQLGVQGTLRSPVISGGLVADSVVVNLPQEILAGTAGVFSIDPVFDNVSVAAAKGSKIETGIGPLVVNGRGSINGTLSDPVLSMPLVLERGTFQLPSGKISLDEGGRILFGYSSLGGGGPIARVVLDIEGHTMVVSRRPDGTYEPYQVTISIQGNALDDKNLRLTAVSDPPDLSQDEILALIGQRDLIQGLAAGDTSRLRDALYSLAVPSFSQGLTQGIAQGLRLDYFSVDYNPFDLFVLSAGKTIAKGLVLHASRQLQESQFGPLRYEIRLDYRLPVSDNVLSKVRLGIGFDQRVPWKVTLGWSKRF